MQIFLQQNRGTSNSPYLLFQRDRLQREIVLRQEEYTTLLISGREARLRELRDTPVISVIEPPHLPLVPESRKVGLRTLMGGLGDAAFAMLLAFVIHGMRHARRQGRPGTKEFFDAIDALIPSRLKKHTR